MKKQSAHETTTQPSGGLRRFLYLTAAVNGAAVLIIEILGAKLLAPYLGTSHFVWTAQIAVTLVSLAAGYYFGGWLVDRSPKLTRLFGCMLGAGFYLCLAQAFTAQVAYASLRFSLPVGALFTSTFLFFVPLTLLAVTGPFLIRVMTASIGSVGTEAGRISAISTAGSVVGTLLIGYLLIPLLPNSTTLLGTAAILMLLSLSYHLVWGRKSRQLPGVAVTLGFGLLIGGTAEALERSRAFNHVVQLERVNSNFGILQVLQTKDSPRRYLMNDYLIQNTYDVERGQSASLFTHMLYSLATSYTPELKAALCIGLGGGIVPSQLAQAGVKVDVVEINPAMVKVAARHFGFDPQRVQLHLGDGRQYLEQTTQQFDSIVLDAFLGDSSPSHLMSSEAFQSMHRRLRPNGTLVINAFGELTPPRNYMIGSLQRTLRKAFQEVRIFASGNGNVFLLATDQSPPQVWREPDFEAMHPIVRHQAEAAWKSDIQIDPGAGAVLTDDFNPVEFFDAAQRERLRRDLAFSMQSF